MPGEGLVTLVQRPLAPAALTADEALVTETVGDHAEDAARRPC